MIDAGSSQTEDLCAVRQECDCTGSGCHACAGRGWVPVTRRVPAGLVWVVASIYFDAIFEIMLAGCGDAAVAGLRALLGAEDGEDVILVPVHVSARAAFAIGAGLGGGAGARA